MNFRTTFVLIVLFMGFGTLAVFDPFHWKTHKEEEHNKSERVFWWKDAHIEWLEIQPEGVRIECDDKITQCATEGQNRWKLTKPVADKADDSSVDSLVGSIRNLSPMEKIDYQKEGISLAEYGLDTTKQILRIKLKESSAPIEMKFGTKSAIGSNVYVHSTSEPEKLFLVASYFPDLLRKDVLHWRDKRLLPEMNAQNIDHISWNIDGKKDFSFKRNSAVEWEMEAPLPVKAHDVMLAGLVSTLTYLSADKVVEENRKSASAQKILSHLKPKIKVQLRSTVDKKSTTEELTFFPKESTDKNRREFYVVSSMRPWLASVDAVPLDRFEKSLSDYRLGKIFTMGEKNQVQNIEFNFPRDKKKVIVKREGNAWKQTSGDSLPSGLASQRIDSLLERLTTAPVQSYEAARLAFWKSQPGDLVLKLKTGDGKLVNEFKFVLDKNSVLVTGELPNEIRVMGEDLLKVVPIRTMDLAVDGNKQVLVNEHKGPDGHH
jgi:hypothetical protein